MRVRKAKPRQVREIENCITLFIWKNTFRTDGILLGPFPGAVSPTSPVERSRSAAARNAASERHVHLACGPPMIVRHCVRHPSRALVRTPGRLKANRAPNQKLNSRPYA